MKKFLLFLVIFLAFLAACSNETTDNSTNQGTDKTTEKSGTSNTSDESDSILNIALNGQPPSLDAHLSTNELSTDVAKHVFETLVAQNADQQPTPVLAESIDKSDDGLIYTFHLRKGVKFHNGKEMKAEDVTASMNRWLGKSSRALSLLTDSSFESRGDYTVELKLQSVASDVLDIMAGRGQFPAIMPKEIIDSAEDEGVTEIIGTGPYEFVEWKQDQYILLKRFDDYVGVEEEPSGITGKKTAYMDEIYYYFVTDPSTRLAGIKTGKYDIAIQMPHDNYEQIKNDADLEAYAIFDNGPVNIDYNKKHGLFSDKKMRDAFNTALDVEEIMLAAYGNKDLYKLNPGYMNLEQVDWATDAGKESYNLNDLEAAKEKFEKAGYNGEEFTILTSRDDESNYKIAVVIQEQLKKIGVNSNLDVVDWATRSEKRDDPENWDILIIQTQYVTTPSQLLAVQPDYVGWTDDQKIADLVANIRTAASHEEAKGLWEELQAHMWNDYLPFTLLGHNATIIATSKDLEGFIPFHGGLAWNLKKK